MGELHLIQNVMKKDNKISDGEKALIDMGLYIANPINLNILLTQNEKDVLNAIRHNKNSKQHYISNSALRLTTGLSENTVRKARDKLLQLGFIEKDGVSTLGIDYKIKYGTLCQKLERLNQEKNPVQRLILADKLRGCGQHIHQKLIKQFVGSEFDM